MAEPDGCVSHLQYAIDILTDVTRPHEARTTHPPYPDQDDQWAVNTAIGLSIARSLEHIARSLEQIANALDGSRPVQLIGDSGIRDEDTPDLGRYVAQKLSETLRPVSAKVEQEFRWCGNPETHAPHEQRITPQTILKCDGVGVSGG